MSQPVELPIEAPQAGRNVKGLVSRKAFGFAAAFILAILIGFFLADVLKASRPQDPSVKRADTAASGVDLGAAPNADEIRTIAKRSQDESKAAVAAQAKASAAANAQGGLERMAIREPPPDTMRDPNQNSPIPVGRSPKAEPQGYGGRTGLAQGNADQSTVAAERMASRLSGKIMALGEEGGQGGESPASISDLGIADKLAQLQAGGGMNVTGGPDGSSVDPAQRQIIEALQMAKGAANAGSPTNQQWLKDYSKEEEGDTTAKVRSMDATYMALQGTRIPVVSLEAVNSDLPGTITARSTVDIYDSLSQRRILIPRQTRFIGSYSSEIRPGQTRVLFAFRRMVLPDGRNVELTGSQGVDNVGRAGVEGEVDNHFLKMFGHSFAIAWIASKVPNNGLTSTNSSNGQSSTTSVAGQVLSQVAQQILQRNANIQPTITRDIGMPFFIMLSKDVVLPPKGSN